MYVKNLLFLLLVSISITDGDDTEEKCFEDPPRPTELNLINETEKMIPIWITTSYFYLQQIIPWIMKIYLNEILGFQNVTIGPYPRGSDTTAYVILNPEEDMEFGTSLWFIYPQPNYITPIELLRWEGWFIPSKFSNYNNWWQFKDPNFARLHPIDPEAMAILQNFKDYTYDPSGLCVASECTIMFTDGVYQITLNQIKENKLYIKMCVLDTYLANVISLLLKSLPFFIITHIYPATFTHSREHFQFMDSPPGDVWPARSTVFKDDEQVFLSSEGSIDKGARFIFLAKTITFQRERKIPTIFKLMKNAYFAPEEYLQFAETDTKACDWLKKHENRTLQWLKEPEERFIIGVILPKEFQLYYDASIFEILARLRLAVEKEYNILSLMPSDPYHTPPQYLMTSEEYSRLIGIVGPARSTPATILRESTKLNGTEVVSYFQEEVGHSFGTIASNETYTYIYPQFFLSFDWRRVAIIADDEPVDRFFAKDISVFGTPMITKSRRFAEIKDILRDVVEGGVKIIIVDESTGSIYGILCAAFHLNMTAEQGYVWSVSGILPEKWWRREFRSKYGDILCTFEELLRVINGHFSVAQVNFGDYDQIMQEGIEIGELRKQLSLGQKAGFLYDACWTFIDAINRLEGNTSNVLEYIRGPGAERFRKIISETDFYGVSGRVRFDQNGSRIADFRIKQFVNGSYRTVGRFQDGILKMDKDAIVWMTGSVPTDGRESSAQSLNVTWVVASIIVVLIILVVFIIFFKKRYDKKMLKTQALPMHDLKEWEIPRNEIVLERKIGEGAFGKVYGGQLLLPEKGWFPVAIKTLKLGCSMLEKSDFLGEVEAMKSFDHPNLIKLIGVCLKTEPVLAVMEFMVHGDLKSYLQARKETPGEIGSERLTRMALDVIKALNYLDELKYVHRDVAARNCLVDSDLVVKLSDFGMSRSLYENDYYRLDRRGLFPVRWMAVESLDSGVFTTKSDIWSFGVLLYEIITYGGTPYHGKTNEEVVQHLKSGKILSVPEDVNPTLKNLMNSCWTMDPTKRPTALEILTCLEANPLLVEPCLDEESPIQ